MAWIVLLDTSKISPTWPAWSAALLREIAVAVSTLTGYGNEMLQTGELAWQRVSSRQLIQSVKGDKVPWQLKLLLNKYVLLGTLAALIFRL